MISTKPTELTNKTDVITIAYEVKFIFIFNDNNLNPVRVSDVYLHFFIRNYFIITRDFSETSDILSLSKRAFDRRIYQSNKNNSINV